jgi:hypothetical protein
MAPAEPGVRPGGLGTGIAWENARTVAGAAPIARGQGRGPMPGYSGFASMPGGDYVRAACGTDAARPRPKEDKHDVRRHR